MLARMRQRHVILTSVIILMVFCLAGCSTLEQKRDKFLAHGKELFEQKDYIRARLEFRNALQIDPKFAEGYLWLGKTELRLNNPRGAYGSLAKAVELDPKLTEGQILLGQIMLAARRLDEAESRVKTALEQEPKNPQAILLAASLAMAQDKVQKALDLLAEVRRLDPGIIEAYLMQAAIEVKRKQPEAADAALEAGLKANPKAINLYVVRSRLADTQKQFSRGEEFLLKAMELEPKDTALGLELARHYGLAGQWDKAEEVMRHNLTLEPEKETHAVELARFLVARGRVKDAEKTLLDFISQHPDNYQARFALVDFYLGAKREGKAAAALNEIIKKDPDGPKGVQAKDQLARLRLSRGHLEEAEKLTTEVLKDNPKDMEATFNQGLLALARKDGLKAVTSFRILTQDQPKNPEAWLRLAQAHLLNNEKEQAKEKARKALELKPDFLQARSFLYGMAIEAKDYDEAIQTIKGYLAAHDKDTYNLNALGDVYAQKGDLAQAQSAFQKIVTLDPKNPLGYYKLGVLSREQKHPDQALKYLDTALAQAPFFPALQMEVAINLEQKHPEKALEVVRRALARYPKNAQFQLLLGQVLLSQKQTQEAISALEEALALNPSGQTLRLLTFAYQQLPDQEMAYKRLEEKTTAPDCPPFYFLVLASIAEAQKKFDKAIEIYNTLLAKDQFAVLARNNLAYLLADRSPTAENLQKALKLASAALEEFPDDASLLDTMGWILYQQGDFAKAKTYLEQSVAQSGDHATPIYHLGSCLAKLGENGKARESLEKALAMKGVFPEREAAEKLLASLPAGGKP